MIGRLFDNGGATFFSIFMAIWAIIFLENWKRYQAELCSRWDVSDAEFSEEQVRPDYQLSVTTKRLNPVTQKEELFLPKKTIAKRFCKVFLFMLNNNQMIIFQAFLLALCCSAFW